MCSLLPTVLQSFLQIFRRNETALYRDQQDARKSGEAYSQLLRHSSCGQFIHQEEILAIGRTEHESNGLGFAEMIFSNRIFCVRGQNGIGFDSEDNEVVLVTRAGDKVVSRRPKAAVAVAILDEVERVRSGG